MRLKSFLCIIMLALCCVACRDNKQQQADSMLNRADQLFNQQKYVQALMTIDSLRRVFPTAIETRKQALRLQQSIELKRSQEELAVLDSTLQAVKHDYESLRQRVEKARQELRATPDELTLLTKTRVYRDSLQTRFDVLCAKIRYIHKKQKEL